MADAVEAAFLDYLHHLTEVRVKDGRLETLIIKSRDQKLSIDELEELRRLTNH
jgi:hypothetical protein